MQQKLNVGFLFILLLLWAEGAADPWQILLGLLLAGVIAFLGYYTKRLTFDGMIAAVVVGTIVYGLGELNMALVLVTFFSLSSIISRDDEYQSSGLAARRNGLQVWANGFWMVLGIILYALLERDVLTIFALSSIAAATADTFATELKSKKSNTTYLITTFEQVRPGTDGGISLQGTFAALLASFGMAVMSALLFSWDGNLLFILGIAGFSGCLIDSYLGAKWERHHYIIKLPVISKQITLNNDMVNILSNGMAAMLAAICYLFIYG